MILLSTDKIHPAKFKTPKFKEGNGLTGSGGNIRSQRYRALNCELEVFDENGRYLGVIPWGISVTQTATKNCSLVRFFRSIGIYRNPEEFNPKELEGMDVMISVNNVCDKHWGLRTVVDHFYPANSAT